MNKTFTKTFFFLLPSLLSAIIPLVTLPLFSRKLSVTDYGLYALCIAFGTFINGLANMGLTTGYERNFFEQKTVEQHGKLLFSIISFVTFTYIFFGFIIYTLRFDFSKWISGKSSYGDYFFLGYLAVSFSSFKQYFLIYFKNIGNAKSFAFYSIDEVLLNMIISIILVVYLNMGVNGLLFGQVLGAFLVTCLLLLRFHKILPFGLSKQLMINCFKISLPLTPRIFFGVIGTQIDKYLISLLGSLGGVGVYNIGQKIAYVVFNYMTALQNVYSPIVYKMMFDDKRDSSESIGQYLTFPFFASAIGGLCVSLFSEDIIYLLTPVEYHEASNVVSILSLLYVIYFFGKQPQLIYAKKTGIISWLTLLNIGLNVGINIPFIMKFGALGAAYGTLLSAIISVIITIFISQKYFYIKWERHKIIYILTCLFLFSYLHIYFRFLNIDWFYRFAIKLLFIAIYIFGAYILRIFKINQLRLFITKTS